jgi:phosphate starvation-inducible PhoH-like protein
MEAALYNGIKIVEIDNDETLARLYEGYNDFDLFINQYIIIKDKEGKVLDKLRWTGTEFAKLTYKNIKNFKPKTDKQSCLFDLLSNKNIPIKIIAGVSGSGKTKSCISYGLYFVGNETYSHLFVVRHNVGIGEKNGFLPGDKFDKIRSWLGFMEDNLDDTQYTIEDLYSKGILKVDGLEYMKGRDLKDSFIIIDEAEDLCEDQFKMLGERPAENSIICFVGDYEQATQDKYKNSSGLKRAINKLVGNPNVGIIVFDDKENDNVRSEVSKIFTYLY